MTCSCEHFNEIIRDFQTYGYEGFCFRGYNARLHSVVSQKRDLFVLTTLLVLYKGGEFLV